MFERSSIILYVHKHLVFQFRNQHVVGTKWRILAGDMDTLDIWCRQK